MNTFSLALRNLLRNRRRSLATLLAMVVGLVAILMFGGYRSNILYGLQTGFVQYGGHLQVQKKGYFTDGGDNPTAYGIAGYDRLMKAIRADAGLAPMLVMVSPSLQLGGIAGNAAAGMSRSVMANGVVPEDANRMMQWNEFGVVSYAKPLPLAGAPVDTVVVGQGVARKLGLCNLLDAATCERRQPAAAGDGAALPDDIAALSSLERAGQPANAGNRIEMLAATAHGAPNVAGLTVVQAKNMGIKAVDDVYMAMHLQQAQRLIYGSGTPQVTAISVQLQHTAQLDAARARLQQLLATQFPDQGLEVVDYKTLNPIYQQTIEFMDSMFGFISMLIGVIVLFTIGNTMSTAVVERTAEVGTLRAMGLRQGGIRRLFLAEALLLGAFGAVIGVVAALLIAQGINHSGWSWTPPGYSYAYLVMVRVADDPGLVAGAVTGMMMVTLMSAWWPARRAARLAIVDALRHA